MVCFKLILIKRKLHPKQTEKETKLKNCERLNKFSFREKISWRAVEDKGNFFPLQIYVTDFPPSVLFTLRIARTKTTLIFQNSFYECSTTDLATCTTSFINLLVDKNLEAFLAQKFEFCKLFLCSNTLICETYIFRFFSTSCTASVQKHLDCRLSLRSSSGQDRS